MRALRIIPLLLTILLVYLLDTYHAGLPAFGKLLDPVNGCMANAEKNNKDFNADIQQAALHGKVTVWLDERMVPHIHATDDHDLYYVEGYIHACNRLWQMDMETRAAAGRVSEVVGSKALKFDRGQRRKGMVYGAEHSLQALEADPRSKAMMDAYTAGINDYIGSLKGYKDYPFEYKLIGFAPEQWTNIKSCLLLKYMADDLTGYTEDIPLTYLRSLLPADEFNLLFPEKIEESTPVIPKGTVFDKPSLSTPLVPNDSLWGSITNADVEEKRNEGKGSNNWAVSGSRTQSGAPILCNDPHLGLNLPSLWYEIQLQTPDMNVYGVSLPGAPGIVIGFNDSLAWGFTNNYRDVKDFYEIKEVENDKNKYWFNGKQIAYEKKYEHIGVKGQDDYIDTVDYTVHGPVIYDARFPWPGGIKKPLAVTWMAHKATNELLAIYLLNRAKDYPEFVDAIMNFQCPAQNMVYADRAGNIAMWGQGQFVNKWKEQGRFVMNGADSSTLWGDLIPMRENPHVLNPEQGYLSSANQSVTDSTYPYWYNGYFYELRAWRINDRLSKLPHANIDDMKALQQDTYSILAANTLPIMLAAVSVPDNAAKKYIDSLKNWDYYLLPESIAATVYQVWWENYYADKWKDKFKNVPNDLWPLPERTMQLMMTTNLVRENNPNATEQDLLINKSFKQTVDSIAKIAAGKMEWYKQKNTTIQHLAKLPALSFSNLKIGGWGNTVNAAKSNHGPSWRMIVQMGKEIEAYGVYPGGQSGNPGSKYYADFLDSWVEGKYYRLQFLPNTVTQNSSTIKYTLSLHP